MGKFLELANLQSTSVSSIQQMDENLFKKVLAKNSVWDFYNMTRDEYNTKTISEKQLLIIKFYNEMFAGKPSFFVISNLFFCEIIQYVTLVGRSGVSYLVSCLYSIINITYFLPKRISNWVAATAIF